MGNPIAGSLAEIFIHHIEQNYILHNNQYSDKIIYWHRYVDDIITLYKGNTRQTLILLKYLNSLHKNLEFTIETEINNTLNFLDISISRTNSLQHKFQIFRKSTMTDTTIHNSSNHPNQHKNAAYNTMIYRLIKTPMDQIDYETELNTIKYIAQQNGYSTSFINKTHNCIKNKILNPITQHKPLNKYLTLPYHSSHSQKLANCFRKFDYKIAFSTNNNIKKLLQSHTQTTDNFDKSGVYKLTCNDCPSFYIGQTGRSFN
jgi:hypothetical protein